MRDRCGAGRGRPDPVLATSALAARRVRRVAARQRGEGGRADRASSKRYVVSGMRSLAVAAVVLLAGCNMDEPAQAEARRPAPPPRFGVNLSGAEAKANDQVRPTLEDVRNYVDRLQFQLIRYPFRPERMTPERIAELRGIADFLRSRRVPLILDRHRSHWDPVADQVAFWTGLARQFPDDGSVMLDLVNEPRGVQWMQWASDAKAVIAGLRRNGIRHPILLEWPGYSGITRFDKGERPDQPCGSAACALERTPGRLDPLNRTFLNGHRYFDKDGSGTAPSCRDNKNQPRTDSGFDRFAAQLRRRGMRGYITESAFGRYKAVMPTCMTVGADAVADLQANSDVLLGVTWWGGGRMWPDRYIFKIECPKADRFTCPPSLYQRMLNPALADKPGPRPAPDRTKPRT
ncbi:hypothetical protein DMC47_20465 [Nostoc sp. 3335mG]|nr:hypothetical protein DMC47_20465 [Nostoc sp. 3335mG]